MQGGKFTKICCFFGIFALVLIVIGVIVGLVIFFKPKNLDFNLTERAAR